MIYSCAHVRKCYAKVIGGNKCWYFYGIKFKCRFNPGKILVDRNPKELCVEFIFDIHMLVLLIMLLLLYDQLNPGKITIRRLPF